MNVLVHTQCLENYSDDEKPWWKFKGGRLILVTGCEKDANAVAFVIAKLQRHGLVNPYWIETPRHWEVVADDFDFEPLEVDDRGATVWEYEIISLTQQEQPTERTK
jgi:hypothetical protein